MAIGQQRSPWLDFGCPIFTPMGLFLYLHRTLGSSLEQRSLPDLGNHRLVEMEESMKRVFSKYFEWSFIDDKHIVLKVVGRTNRNFRRYNSRYVDTTTTIRRAKKYLEGWQNANKEYCLGLNYYLFIHARQGEKFETLEMHHFCHPISGRSFTSATFYLSTSEKCPGCQQATPPAIWFRANLRAMEMQKKLL